MIREAFHYITVQEAETGIIPDDKFQAIMGSKRKSIHRINIEPFDNGDFLVILISVWIRNQLYFFQLHGLGFDRKRLQWQDDKWNWQMVQDVEDSKVLSLEEAAVSVQQERQFVRDGQIIDEQLKNNPF